MALGVVLILPLAAATTFTAPYSNANHTLYPFTTGTSAVSYHGLFGPLTGTGKTVFWHNSTVGQAGTATAEFGALQGFSTGATVITAGTHTVTPTWSWNGQGVIGINCFGGGGSGQAVITEKVEVNLWNVGSAKWLFTNNLVSQIWTHSITVCGTWSFYTFS
ncbi:MAG: hypothetical protein L3K17_10275, partial [Thermoplasmata archaeon]|nr:hypothetical protein [Thermoplasmata archaeon]